MSEEAGGDSSHGVHHTKNDVYSESLPIPSIQRFFKKGLSEVIASRDIESEEESSSADSGEDATPDGRKKKKKKKSGKSDKGPASGKPRRGETRIVDDPITGTKVAIHDVGKKEYRRAMNEADGADDAGHEAGAPPAAKQAGHAKRSSISSNLSKRSSKDMNGKAEPKQKRHQRDKPENVLLLPFPPETALPPQPWQGHPFLMPLFAVWSVVTLLRIVHPAISILSIAWLGWWNYRSIYAASEDRRWHRERMRGEGARKGYYNEEGTEGEEEEKDADSATNGIIEGAEWLNSLLESLWSVMNSDLFSSIGSTLEDVLQASTNGQSFIQAVKVEDLGQGSTPLRMTGFRVLGDSEAVELRKEARKAMHASHKKEAIVDTPHAKLPGEEHEQHAENKQKEEKNDDEAEGDDGGNFINFEISFVYRARPTTNALSSRNRNAHLLIKFWVGARKVFTVPLPVWVEIKGFVGKVRARLQLTPDPPFIKNVTFSLMGLPRTEVSVIPLRINAQNIPFLSGFIQKSMDAAIGEYCAPSSMTIDLGEMLMGDSIKREVNAMGVVMIYIHRAFDLEKQDVRGSSDPYCTVSLKKHGKIQYCTRVALDDLSPRWEERCFLIISPEAVRAKEKISISLWDSDRLSADDVLGQAEVDLGALVRRPGKMFRRTDTLVGLTKEMSKQGTIQWSVGYFQKAPNTRGRGGGGGGGEEGSKGSGTEQLGMADMCEEERSSNSAVKSVDEQGDADAEMLDEDDAASEICLPEDDKEQTRNKEHGVSFEAPSVHMPTGILSLQIHQVTQLELVDTKTHRSPRQSYDTAQKVDTIQDEQDTSSAPSSYVTIILNDETVFRSRTKALNSNPFFNAGTERMVTDWSRTLVMFVVWDSRLREEDAILGVVPLKLSDVFTKTSQVTQFFPLAGGVGQGKIRLSLLFRPVQGLDPKREKLGWNIGTMRIQSSLVAKEFDDHFSSLTLRTVTIRAKTLAGKVKLSAKHASHKDEDNSLEWKLGAEDGSPIKVPVRRRYATPFVMEFRALNALGVHKTIAMSVVWMQDLGDDEVVTEKIPIWQPKDGGHDFHRLEQNYHNFRKEEEAQELGVQRVGYLYVSLQFKSGAGKIHNKFGRANPDVKEVMQAWACCAATGLRSVNGDFVDLEREANDDEEGEQEDDSSEGEEVEGEDEDASLNGKPEGNPKKSAERTRKSKEGKDNDDDDDDADDDAGMFEKLRKWSEERKELNRQHRGIKQYKAARTASWLGRGVRETGNKGLKKLHLQDRRFAQVESEL